MRAYLILFSFVLGCTSADDDDVAGFPDATVNDRDGGVDPGGPEFEFEVVAGLNSAAIYGDNAVLAIGPNGPTIAHGVVPAGSATREIHVADRMSDGTWM